MDRTSGGNLNREVHRPALTATTVSVVCVATALDARSEERRTHGGVH